MYVLPFDDVSSNVSQLVGGKAINLSRMTQAGLPVPTGFTVTTEAYGEFLRHSGIGDEISRLANSIEYKNPDQMTRITDEIRALVLAADFPPAVLEAISAAHLKLGTERFVAVRSSGTAEDLATASFAGLHDTYLDVKGAAHLQDAIKRCWASFWTARAAVYRHDHGFDHFEASIAVVVQAMVESDVSGVMFTGNPLTAATDEFLINASWGLGEAVVQGIVTPDEYVVRSPEMRIIRRTLGNKRVRIVRDLSSSSGTVSEDVPIELQDKQALSDQDIADLASLGWDVMEYYQGFPQDIEWALANGELYLLQSRPITGVEFSWDADADAWQTNFEDENDVWTRGWADEVWSGAITPLTYSFRAKSQHDAEMGAIKTWGYGEVTSKRLWKFHKSEAYRNAKTHRTLIERTAPKEFRPALLAYLPRKWHQEVIDAPFSLKDYASIYLRVATLKPEVAVHRAVATAEKFLVDSGNAPEGKSDSELRRLSDAMLKRYLDKLIAEETEYFEREWTTGFLYFRDGMLLLNKLIMAWYSGDNSSLYMDLISGVSKRTKTVAENIELWHLANRMRNSARLIDDFKRHGIEDWLSAFEQSDDGRAFLAHYRRFLSEFGHRGHADRDLIFSRRSEDPGIDYRALQSLLAADGAPDPEVQEHNMRERRKAAIQELFDNVQQQPFGLGKVEVFRALLDFLDRFMVFRDDERYYVDRYMMVMKRCYVEVGRRLVDRGVVAEPGDVFFLTHDELFELLAGYGKTELARAKIVARRRNFDHFHVEGIIPPSYLQHGIAADLDAADDATGNKWRGIGTSRGSVTGIARIVRRIEDINLVQQGEILVTNHTDPGWTPVFMLISGIVLETGGALAHGSCLAREYGFPAVQIANAMQLISDGARIAINGDTGEVALVADDPLEPDGLAAEVTAST